MRSKSCFQFPVSGFIRAGRKPLVRGTLLALLVALSLASPCPAEQAATELVRLKMTELAAMHGGLGAKAAQADTISAALDQQKAELSREIRERAAQRGLRSFAEAQADARIAANLKLIGLADAYHLQLRTKSQRFEAGREKLADLMRRVEDDLMMLGQIKGLAVDQLVIQIDQALGRCQADADGALIDAATPATTNPEAIWQATVTARNQ